MKLCMVIDAFRKSDLINVDLKCSLHVHIDVSDLNDEMLANVLRLWLKCEPVFFDSVSDDRKENQYCKFMGLWDFLRVDEPLDTKMLLEFFGYSKYGSSNIYHRFKGEGNTFEVRLGENSFCKNSFFSKNWIKLLIYFVEVSSKIKTNNLSWMDVKEVFGLLNFINTELSPGMIQMGDWFLARLYYNSLTSLSGFFTTRIVTKKQIGELLDNFPKFNLREALYPSFYDNAVYSKIYY